MTSEAGSDNTSSDVDGYRSDVRTKARAVARHADHRAIIAEKIRRQTTSVGLVRHSTSTRQIGYIRALI